MKKLIASVVLITLVFCFFPYQRAKAFGFGCYTGFNVGSGSMYHEFADGYRDYNPNVNGFNIGFLMDTKVKENKLINYRLNVGFSYASYGSYLVTHRSSDYTYQYLDVDDASYVGVEIDNTIGFGFFKDKSMRLWAGPKFKIRLQRGSGTTRRIYENNDSWTGPWISLGGAPVVGSNFHLSERLSLCADVGFNMLYCGGVRYGKLHDREAQGLEYGFFFNVSVLFHKEK